MGGLSITVYIEFPFCLLGSGGALSGENCPRSRPPRLGMRNCRAFFGMTERLMQVIWMRSTRIYARGNRAKELVSC